jgi:hypothetical protein
MACDTMRKVGVSPVQRAREVGLSLERLERALKERRARVTIAPNGAIAFAGWTTEERDGVTDACAYRRLTAKSSWELRQAVARAEAEQGRKVNQQAIAAGFHSHDGGASWGRH